ncbi:beta strand repeat-containing protein [Chloroflexota bacterium]
MPPEGFVFPEITLNPNSGPANTKVTVVGTNFPAGANVTGLWFGGEMLTIAPVNANADGDFTLVFTVPSTLWGMPMYWGWYPVELEAEAEGQFPVFIMKDFQVTSADVTFTMKADPNWLPPIAPGDSASTTIYVESIGVGASVSLSVEHIPPGVDWSFSSTTITVPPGGSASSSLTISPTNIPPGWYGAEIKGIDTANNTFFTHLEFEVMPPEGFVFPEITLNPNSGPANTKVTVVGTNFPPGANVTGLWFGGEMLTIAPVNANADGDFTLVFTVPGNIGIGYYMIEIEAEAQGTPPVFIIKPFEVTSSTEVSFSMWVVPDWIQGIEQGSAGSTTVNIEAASQEVTVVLSVDGLPFGATAEFTSVNSTLTAVPGGKSSTTLTITTSASTPPGKYPLSIKGTSGNSTRIVGFGFGVKMPAAFAIPELSLDPDFAPAGYGDKKLKITFSGNGFPKNQEVSLKFAGSSISLPEGFSTDENGTFNGVFQLPSGLDAGTYMAEVVVGGKKDVRPFTIKAAGSTFIIDTSPPFLPPILQGTSANATVTVTSVSTTSSTVIMSIIGLPEGTTAVFLPSANVTVSPGSSSSATVSINVGAGVVPGPYSLSIFGISGNETVSVPFGFGVMPKIGEGEGHATVTINPPSGNPNSNITIAGAGFNNGQTVTITAAPEGAATAIDITPGIITVQSGGTWGCQMTIPPAAQVPPGIYIIRATDGTVSAKAKLDIVSEETDTLTLSLSPSYLKVTQGQYGNVILSVTSQNKFKDVLQFNVGGLPVGVTATFTDAKEDIVGKYQGSTSGEIKVIIPAANVTAVPGESLTIDILLETDNGTPLGPYVIPLEVNYSQTTVELLNLVIIPAEANLVISPNVGTVDTDVNLSGAGFSNGETISVAFSTENITTVPAAITVANDGTFTGMITIPKAEAGLYTITATGMSSNTSAEATFQMKPSAANTFILSAKPGQISVPQGGTGTFKLGVEPSGSFNSEVSLTLSGLTAVSSNASASFTPASGNVTPVIGTPVSASLRITVPTGTNTGTYPLTVIGTSGSIIRNVKLSLKVVPAAQTPDFSIGVAPTSVTIKVGESANATVSVVAVNSFNGTVDLSLAMSDNATPWPTGLNHNAIGAQITPSLTTNTGSKVVTFATDNTVEPGNWAIDISGTGNSLTHTANITIMVVAANVTTSTSSSPLVDPTTISRVTPLTVTTVKGDIVQINSIIPEVQQPLSVITETVNTQPYVLGDIPVNWGVAHDYVTNVGASTPIAAVDWQFTVNYNSTALESAGINANKLSPAYLDPGTGNWVVGDIGVVLRFAPSATSVTDNSTITVDIVVEAGSQPVAGVDTFVSFDTDYLEVTDITPNLTSLGTQANLNMDNTNGYADYSALKSSTQSYPTGTFTIATITFQGKASSATLPISLTRSGVRMTDAAYAGDSIISAIYNSDSQITFTNLTHFSVWTVLGRLSEPVAVLRLIPSTNSVIIDNTCTVDIQVEATDQAVASVDAFINFDPAYLEVTNITPNTSKLGTTANLSMDNTNGYADYSALKSAIQPYPSGTFTIATITFRGLVESENVTLSFNEVPLRESGISYGGNPVLGGVVGDTVDVVYDAPLRLDPASIPGIGEGEEFTLALQVDAGDEQQVSSADAFINFDTTYLEVIDITPDLTSLGPQVNLPANEPTVEVNLGNTVTLGVGENQTNIPVDIKNFPDLGLGNGLGAFGFILTWDNAVINVTGVTAASAPPGYVFVPGAIEPGTTIIGGYAISNFISGNFTVAYLAITAVGSVGESTPINVTIDELTDVDVNPVAATPVNATAKINLNMDNTNGYADYSVNKSDLQQYPTGTFTIATITFRGKQVVDETAIIISVSSGNRTSAVGFDGTTVYGAHTDTTVRIVHPDRITGRITLQGGQRPLSGLDVPLTIKLYDSATVLTYDNVLTEVPLYTFSTASDITIAATDYTSKTIIFETSIVPPGTYNIVISSPHQLINLRNGVTIGATLVEMGTLLEGNANDDVQITGADFCMLLYDYLQVSGGDDWHNGRCDFDRNGQVTALDFSLLVANYAKTSPQTVGE